MDRKRGLEDKTQASGGLRQEKPCCLRRESPDGGHLSKGALTMPHPHEQVPNVFRGGRL